MSLSVSQFSGSKRMFAPITDFPGWERAGNFLCSIIADNGFKMIGDIGGGRMPRVSLEFVRQQGLQYHLFDISAKELALAAPGYHKVQMDVACDDQTFEGLTVPRDFDLIFSHMLLEHLLDPLQAHRNFFKMLKPGGLSVHMFPSKHNFPLFVNGLIPEAVSTRLLKFLQPFRDQPGQEGKFKAYYKHCGPPSPALRAHYESLGFEILAHTSFVGHDYYKRIVPLAALEKKLRTVIVNQGLPIITANLLILRKPLTN